MKYEYSGFDGYNPGFQHYIEKKTISTKKKLPTRRQIIKNSNTGKMTTRHGSRGTCRSGQSRMSEGISRFGF